MKLYVVRHGQTDNNLNGIIQGISNTPLNDYGRKQANELKEELNDISFDLILSSPLQRAKETAEIINNNKTKIIIDNRLIERNTGDFEGKKYNTYNHEKSWDYKLNTDLGANIERVQSIFKRAGDFLEDIKRNYPDKTILVVSHAAFIRALHYSIVGFSEDENLRALKISNCSLFQYDI